MIFRVSSVQEKKKWEGEKNKNNEKIGGGGEKITLFIFHYVFSRSNRKVNINILYYVKKKTRKDIRTCIHLLYALKNLRFLSIFSKSRLMFVNFVKEN